MENTEATTTSPSLIDYALISKKALQLAEQQCSRANALVQQARMLSEEMEAVVCKCRFTSEVVDVQLDLAGEIRSKVAKQSRQLSRFKEAKLDEHKCICEALEAVIIRIKNTKVDPVISKQSLLDHADLKGITELSVSVTQRVSELHKVQAGSNQVMDGIETLIESFTDRLKQATKLPDVDAELTASKLRLGEGERNTESMAEILTSLMRHYDQVTAALKAFQEGEHQQQEDLDVLAQDTKELTPVMDELQGLLESIETIHSDIIVKHDALFTTYNKRLHDTLSLLNKMGDELSGFADDVKAIDDDFDNIKIIVDAALDQLYNVVTRYERMVIEYHSLVLEMQRRALARKNIDAVVASFQEAAALWLDGETAARRQYLEKHTNAIPQELYPRIFDEPPNFTINVLNDYQLDELSPESIEQAKSVLVKDMKSWD